jgi:hypothetical protein
MESPSPSEEPSPEAETVPEGDFNKESLNILLENSGMLGEDEVIDLSKAKKSLGEMENELNKLLRN